MISEHLTIHQFEHTKLIGHHITFGINTVAIDVCCRSVIAADKQAVIFDALYQCPQTNQVSVTIEIFCDDLITRTDASVDLLFDLCCFLLTHELSSSRHLTGKIYNLFYISERLLIVQNVSIRFDELHRFSIIPDGTIRHCDCITKVALSIIASVRSDDNLLRNYLTKLVSDRIGAILITTAKTNKITLNDSICARQIIKARMQNTRNFTLIECINLFMIVCNTNLFLVKDCLGSYKEFTTGRVDAPYNGGSTVDLNGQGTRIHEPIQNGQVAREDGIFGVFEVGVLHALKIPGIQGQHKR